jgi:hypothetical protein
LVLQKLDVIPIILQGEDLMKRSLLIATGLVLLSTSAFATKTRMTALGQDAANGSRYIDDTRNVFRNAAHAGSTTNYVVSEWGNLGSTAEGGFFKEAGSFNYGVYLNSRNDAQNGNNGASLGTTGTDYAGVGAFGADFSAAGANRSDDIDLFFAGDMGFQWGARIGYSSSDTKAAAAGSKEQTHDGMSLGAGAVFGDIEASVNFVLKDEYAGSTSTSNDKLEGDKMDINVAYNWGSWTFFGDYDSRGADYTSGTKAETSRSTITLGAGHTHEVSSTARIYTDITYNNTKGTHKAAAATVESERKTSNLQVNLGFEADATSWLTWRGSIRQNVLMDKTETKTAPATTSSETNGTSTTLNAGATLNFGKLKVDGTIGTATGAAGAGGLSTDALLTQVALHYWF